MAQSSTRVVRVFLVHHGEAIGPEIDVRRPLTPWGRERVERAAADAAARGAKPSVVWHSGKLRARQTAEALGLETASSERLLRSSVTPAFFSPFIIGLTICAVLSRSSGAAAILWSIRVRAASGLGCPPI